MRSILSFLLGAMLTLSFAPFDWWPLAFVGLTGLCILWQCPVRDRPARYGFFFGLGNFSTGIYWVYISLQNYGGASLFVSVLANIALIIYLALYPCLIGFFLRCFSRSASLHRALLIPLFWALGEWLRAYILTGFPWLSIGYSQLYSFLHGIAPLGGVFTLGFALIFICTMLAYALLQRRIWPIALTTILGISAYLTQFLQFTQPVGQPLSIALIQGNHSQLTKFDPVQMEKNLSDYISLSSLRNESIIIWPETAFAYLENYIREDTIDPLDALYRQRGQTLVAGIPTGDTDKSIYYNSVITLGVGSGRYLKDHLLPFGEFIPFRSVLGFIHRYINFSYSDFSRGGKNQPPILTQGIPAGVSICFEAAFGRVIRRSLPTAQYLINVTNDGWFGKSIATDQHLQINQMRALEFGREIARANNNGYTAFINSDGTLQSTLPRFQQGVLSGKIQPRIGSTPYARFGNGIFAALLGLYAIMLVLIILPRIKIHHARAI